MSLFSIVIGGTCFAAGVVAGVLLCDKDYLNAEDLKTAGGKVVEYTRGLAESMKKNRTQEPPTQLVKPI